MLRLGDGTQESHDRAQKAVNDMWRFTGEMFQPDDVDREMAAAGIGVDLDAIKPKWEAVVRDVLTRATLTIPDEPPGMTAFSLRPPRIPPASSSRSRNGMPRGNSKFPGLAT